MNKLYGELKISKQAVYKQRKRMENHQITMYELRCQLEAIREEHPGCGLEKIYIQLMPEGVGRDQFIGYFMDRGYGLKRRKNRYKTTIPTHLKYANLIDGLLVYQINMVWQTDITYYRIGDRFYYLVFILDIYSRRILGYQASNHLRAQANILALIMAYNTRDCHLSGLIHHSDRGSQYVDKKYIEMLDEKSINISMGLRGQDNAYAERVNGIIKNEYLQHWNLTSLQELKRKLKKAVDHYNHKRPHRSLPGRLSPVSFEEQLETMDASTNYNEWIYSEKINVNQKKYILSNELIPDKKEKTLICPLIEC